MNRREIAIALGTVLGLQTMRALFPLLVYVLRDRFGFSTAALGGLSFVLFASAFAMPWMVRRMVPARALGLSLLALATVRLLLQLHRFEPGIGWWAAAAGAPLFLFFLAAAHREPSARTAVALLMGALIDLSLHGLWGTRDLHWGGLPSDVGALLLGLAGLSVGARLLRTAPRHDTSGTCVPTATAAIWGPWLFLHLEVLGNVARFSATTGLTTAAATVVLAAGLALGLFLALRLANHRHRAATALCLGLVLLVAIAVSVGTDIAGGRLAFLALPLAHAATALLLTRALAVGRAVSAPPGPSQISGWSLAFGGGFFAFFLLLFSHYAAYDLQLPVTRRALLLAAAALLLAATYGPALIDRRPSTEVTACGTSWTWRLRALVLFLVLLPLLRYAKPTPQPGERNPGPLRVVTFNLHNGFDERGAFSFDRMLVALRAEDPDIVALQEVSRGWVINGSADLYELAREALGLEAIAGPSVDPDWGNAVFVRQESRAVYRHELPPPDLPLPRAVLATTLAGPMPGAAAGTPPFTVFATHLHHAEGGGAIREQQARSLAAWSAGCPAGVLLGDFNTPPESPTMMRLAEVGWRDCRPVGDPAPTYPSAHPKRRIDTIFLRGPWRAVSSRVAPDWGSDHRAVIVEIEADSR